MSSSAPTEVYVDEGGVEKRMIPDDYWGQPLILEYRKGDTKISEGHHFYMQADYGFIPGTTSPEEEELDYFMGPDRDSKRVFMASLLDDNGVFVENKMMLGFNTEYAARELFCDQYSESRCGPMLEMTLDDLKSWVAMQWPKAQAEQKMRDAQPELFLDPDLTPPISEVDPEPPLIMVDCG